MLVEGMNFKECCAEIRNILGVTKINNINKNDEAKDIAKNKARLNRVREGLIPISRGTAAHRYLRKRGISVNPAMNCKAHNGIPYYDNRELVGVFPAMVSTIMDSKGVPSTLHITYLTPDGDKLECSSPKKILPTAKKWIGGAIRLFDPVDVLAVCEGVETSLAAYQEDEIPVWATVNATAMESLVVPDSVKLVIIYADSDSSFAGQKSAYVLASKLRIKKIMVKVILLTNDGCVVDKGLDIDFLDYITKNTVTDKAEAWNDTQAEAPLLADNIAETAAVFGKVKITDLELDNGKTYKL